ncbi:MAG: Ig-like domain-containing protein [Pirellulaceae bacterium]
MYGNTIRKQIQFPSRRTVGKSFPKKTFAGEPLEPRHLLAGDLVAHWESQVVADQLENGAVISEWTDSVSGIVASAEGAPTLEEIALGGRPAIRLDPADSPDWFLVTSVDSPFRNIGDYTLAVVFATSSSNLQGAEGNWFQNTAIVDANSQGLANDWGLSINANGRLAAGLGNGFLANPTNVYSQETGLNDGQTHLAIVRRTGNNVAIRVDDGAFVTSTMNSNPLSTLDVAFGAQKRGDAALDGYLAEVRMYNGALDETQLADLYSQFTTTYDNQAPQANPDIYTLAEDTNLFLVGDNNGLLLNDTDADGDALKAQLIETTTHGELGVNPDGSFIYVPDENFFGTDSFTYAAVDFRPSAPVTVTLNVTPVYDPAVATADSYKTVPHEALVVSPANSLLLNDLNPDNADLSVELVQDVNAGSLQLQPNGTFTYNAQGFAGTASFTYRIFDGTGYSAPATVTITSNTPPQAIADMYQLDEDTLLTIGPDQGVLVNDIDADGNTLTVEIISETAHGDIGLGPDGSIVYSPVEDFFGTDQFTYRITDGIDPSNEATVQLTVRSVNDAPIAAVDSYFTLPNSPLTVSAERGVLDNDLDVDGPATVVTVTSAPQHGSLQMNNDGSFVYTPQANFEGEDAFTYVYGDSIQQSEPTRVTLTVSSRPILISELHATNASGLTTRVRSSADDAFRGDTMTPDWIELKNRVAARWTSAACI